MGLQTLRELRSVVQGNLGERGFDNEDVDNWINTGYIYVVFKGELDEFKRQDLSETVIGNPLLLFTMESDLAVINLRVNGQKLIYSPPDHFTQSVYTGVPRKWTRIGHEIYVSPPPDSAYPVSVLSISEPRRLVRPTDKTVIASQYDHIITSYATHLGYMRIREYIDADVWIRRTDSLLLDLVSTSSIGANTVSDGVWVPRSVYELDEPL